MAQKIQRWLDLLAALLRRNYPAPFEELVREVPAYQDPTQVPETRRRMFERDKDELRAFGIPILTRFLDDNDTGYQLDRKDFYLPYLSVLRDGQMEAPQRRVDRYGYRTLPVLAFEPDELQAIEDTGPRLKHVGIPSLFEDARSALRKLGADLRLEVPNPGPAAPAAEHFDLLDDALQRRKRVTFTYRSLSSDTQATRTVAPYGLFFLGHHWYMAGADETGTVKNFRLSRMSDVAVNAKRPGTTDYIIPEGFDLRQHARSKQAWELGDADLVEATVRIFRSTGAARTVARLGDPVSGHPDQRLFRVRRLDVFARWLLGFAGAAVPISPAEVVDRFRVLARETLTLYRPVDP